MVKRNLLIQAALIGAFGLSTLAARDIRTPLNLQNEPVGHFHIPIFLTEEEREETGRCWDIDVWGGGYAQNASDAFAPCNNDRVNVSELLFGQENFTVAQIFANGVVSSSLLSPVTASFLEFATLKPRVEYNEEGIVVGFNVSRRFMCGRLHTGLRVNLPYRVVEMQNRNCGCDLGEENLSDVARCASDLYGAYPADPLGNSVGTGGTLLANGAVGECAYRLDFLNGLSTASGTIPLISWAFPQTFNPGNTNVTKAGTTQGGNYDSYSSTPSDPSTNMIAVPMHLLQETPGTVPLGRFAAGEFQVGVNGVSAGTPGGFAYPVLDADGAAVGGVSGSRWVWGPDVDYTPLSNDLAAQSKFWLVPTFYTPVSYGPAPDFDPTYGAITQSNQWARTQTLIENLIELGYTSPSEILSQQGISFDSQTQRGVGNLDTTIFAGYDFLCDRNLYGEGRFGVRWPTDKRDKNPLDVYRMATGNDGHYEIRVGTQWYYQPLCWLGFNFEGDYFHVFKSRENVAASFVGATIKNLNPAIDAKIGWDYGMVKFDLDFFHPNCPGLGFVVGYEFYGKSKDKVEFVSCNDKPLTQANDLFGDLQTLDAGVLASQTQRFSHKMRLEFFHHWSFGDLFMGWTQVVGGKNIMRETAWHIGMVVQY